MCELSRVDVLRATHGADPYVEVLIKQRTLIKMKTWMTGHMREGATKPSPARRAAVVTNASELDKPASLKACESP